MYKKNIMIAAGGTGGHLFPAEALAKELLNRDYKVIMVTDKRGDVFKSLGDKVEVKKIKSATFKAGLVAKLKAMVMLKIGSLQSLFLLLKYRPAIVIGFGGYPSFPPIFTAQLLFFKTMIVEQNAVLGKANIFLAPLATKIATALPNTKGVVNKYDAKAVVTGNPVRDKICALRDKPYPKIEGRLNILITGGSQGAKIFSNIVPKALVALAGKISQKLFIIQQVIEEDIEAVKELYKQAGIEAEIASFIYDMDKKIEQSHIFIGRSGAGTVSEIAVAGVPAIFVPIAYHADQQQLYNAKIIADKGGAWIIEEKDFTETNLLEMLEHLANTPNMLENAAIASKACGNPDAVINLANLVETII